MTHEEALKEIFGIMKKSQKEIDRLRANKSLENPIQIDLVKTRKAMSYEEVLEVLKMFSEAHKNHQN